MIKAATLENRFETDLITDLLEKEGIDHVIKPFTDTAYNGIFVTQKGYALLLVEEDAENRAKEIVESVRSSVIDNGQSQEDEEEDEPVSGESEEAE